MKKGNRTNSNLSVVAEVLMLLVLEWRAIERSQFWGFTPPLISGSLIPHSTNIGRPIWGQI